MTTEDGGQQEEEGPGKRHLAVWAAAAAGLALLGFWLFQSLAQLREFRENSESLGSAAEADAAAANGLLATRNRLLAEQVEAARNASMASTLAWAATEAREAGGVSEAVEAQLVALSWGLGPVGAVGDDGLLTEARWSRERGQLVVALSGLGVTNFQKFLVRNADLSHMELRDRTLDWLQVFDADTTRANFHGSVIRDSVFADGVMRGVRMQGCDLTRTVLAANVMVGADLRGATLKGVFGWERGDWLAANIHGVKDAPEGFVEFVLGQGGLSVPDEFWEEDLLLNGLEKSAIPQLKSSSPTFAKRYTGNLQSALGIALEDEEVRRALAAAVKAYQAERDAR